MAKTVLVHSESRKGRPVYAVLGSRRWECEWYELTERAERRRLADPDNYEHDRDCDEVCCSSAHRTKEQAIEAGRKEAKNSVYGVAIVQEHSLDWYVEEDNVGEWEPTGPQIEVDAATGEANEV